MAEGTPQCPRCGTSMRLRTGRSGAFYGCTKYEGPNRGCQGTRPADGGSSGQVSAGRWRSGGANTIKAQYAGRCAGCGADYDKDESVLYDGRVVGCPACSPAATQRGAKGAPVLIVDREANAHWRALVESDTSEPTQFTPMPLKVRECQAITPCTLPLDDYQREVVNWRKGEAVVLAGAGSGKSTVLLERLAALLREGVIPEALLLLVYNKAAANEFRTRLRARVGDQLAMRIPVATFHSWAYGCIQAWLPGRFGRGRVVDTEEGPSALSLARKACQTANLEMDAKQALRLCDLLREALVDVDAPDAIMRAQELPQKLSATVAKEAVAFTRAYQQVKARLRVIDFGDMLTLVCASIVQGGVRAAQLRERFRYVMVDEAQDTNVARMVIAAHLGGGAFDPWHPERAVLAPRLLQVGDARQSIYAFTGARPEVLRQRLKLGATQLELPVNRRCSKVIVAAGNSVCRGREWNLGGACIAAKQEKAEPLRVWYTESAGEEADAVTQEVVARVLSSRPAALREDGVVVRAELNAGLMQHGRPRFVCLVRTNGQAAALEMGLMARNIPVRVLGQKGGVWASSPGRDVLAYLRGAEGNPAVDLGRIANKPKRYLKRDLAESAATAFKQGGVPTVQMLAHYLRDTRDRGAAKLATDLEGLGHMEWRERCLEVRRLLLEDAKDRGQEAGADEDAQLAYQALTDAALKLGSVEAIDAQIRAMTQLKETEPAVEISTIHGAKGKEYPVVFVCGVNAALLPHERAEDVEEELRLLYVAVTRAIETCILSTGSTTPSPFLRKVLEHTEDEDDSEEAPA